MNLKFVISSLGVLALSVFGFGATNNFKSDEILVKFQPNSEFREQALNVSLGSQVIDQFDTIGVKRIKLATGMTVAKALTAYKNQTFVLYAEPNFIRRTTLRPNDPDISLQYGLTQVSAFQAWDLCIGSPNVVIAIIDTGLDVTHPEFTTPGKVVQGYDFVNKTTNMSDPHGHGTHCAGNAASTTNNAIGTAGLGFNCAIMPVRVLDSGGSGSDADVMSGIQFATQNGAKVISMSLGGADFSKAFESMINYAYSHNVLVVAAAGNNGSTSKFYPAAFTNCVAVAATNQNNQRAGFSNYGADWVDVAAPGEGIYSTLPGGYGYESGTSMACPFVAGLGGLLWTKAGSLARVADIRKTLESSCDNVGNFVKWGRINAFKAMKAVKSPAAIEFNPVGVSMIDGSGQSGSLASVFNVDFNYYAIDSFRDDNVGAIASAVFTFQLDRPADKFTQLSMKVTANGMDYSTAMLWLYNFDLGQYEYVSSFTLFSSGSRLSTVVAPSSFASYVDSGRTLRLAIRSVMPLRNNPLAKYSFKIDQILLRGIFTQ